MRQFIKKNIWAVAPVVFVLVALVLLGSPFGSGNVQETPAEDDNLIVVGVSQVGSESVWRTAHTQSVQDAFTRANGYLLIFDNARQKQANQIKAIRMKLGLTQKQYADKLGVSLGNLKHWEQNRKQIFKSTWEKYFKQSLESRK